jgi:hypothetical protein
MNIDLVQLMRVSDELVKYLYVQGARKIQASYDFSPDRSYCALSAHDLVLPEAEIQKLSSIFSNPIQPEIASYYGVLAGNRQDDAELELLGTMAELEELISMEGAGTKMILSRREAEYYRS